VKLYGKNFMRMKEPSSFLSVHDGKDRSPPYKQSDNESRFSHPDDFQQDWRIR
jgi:hypothetical protein